VSTGVALIWDPDESGHYDSWSLDPIAVGGHQIDLNVVHVWLDAADGPKLATLDLTLEAAETLATHLIIAVATQRGRAQQSGAAA
jgi:hypothetical protein